MNASYYQLAVTDYLRVLDNLTHLIDKASEYAKSLKIEERVLLDARLFPDMFPLIRQIRMVCDMTKNAGSWLTGVDAPKFDDTETSFAELKERAAKAKAFLGALKESDFAESKDRLVRLPWNPNAPLKGDVFLLQHSIPNVFFHLTTAYNILRHNGVPIGKADYLGKIG
ncbi:MAG: DUF1993 domain-containing protein [Burkholderiales bacterium]|nr:DUF1993 domain-containing protein [Burkholderiales bacterium]